MKKTVIMIMGKSGCGKSTLENQLLTLGNVKKVISVTTRDPREGEVDGVDYHFITNDHFKTMVIHDDLIQTTEFAGNHYGSAHNEYLTDDSLVTLVVVPASAKELKDRLAEEYPDIDVRIVYFDVSNATLLKNMRARGDSDNTIRQRLMQDNLAHQMKETGLEPDFIVYDFMLTPDLYLQLLQSVNY
jgi:guanylate kinase